MVASARTACGEVEWSRGHLKTPYTKAVLELAGLSLGALLAEVWGLWQTLWDVIPASPALPT